MFITTPSPPPPFTHYKWSAAALGHGVNYPRIVEMLNRRHTLVLEEIDDCPSRGPTLHATRYTLHTLFCRRGPKVLKCIHIPPQERESQLVLLLENR